MIPLRRTPGPSLSISAEHGMTFRLTARRTLPLAGLTFAGALAALIASLPADAAVKHSQKPPRQTEETAPRAAGEPIMAIVSIKSQKVTIYDADGWILRAPVSTGISGRETPT